MTRLPRSALLAWLMGGCGLDGVELVPGSRDDVWLVDVDAASAARFAGAREKAVPDGELALRSPVEGGIAPENAPLGVAWFDKRAPGPKEDLRPCELVLRSGERRLRAYSRGPFAVPAERWAKLVRDGGSRELSATLRCARDAAVSELSAASELRFSVGPLLLAEGLVVWSEGELFLAHMTGDVEQVGDGVSTRYGFGVGSSCAEVAFTTGKGELVSNSAWAAPAEPLSPTDGLAVSADGHELALVSDDRLRVLDTQTGAVLGERAIPDLSPAAPVFGADGSLYIALAGAGAPKPAMAGAIAHVAREAGGSLAAPTVLPGEPGADELTAPAFFVGDTLWGTSAHGKLEAPKDARVVRLAGAGFEPAIAPLDKASDSDPAWAPSGDGNRGYVLFASTRPLTTNDPMPEQQALWLSACPPSGPCSTPLWWPLDRVIAAPRRALFCATP